MSQSGHITRTVTTSGTTTSTLILNTGYLKSKTGLLKFVQLLLGAVAVGLMICHNRYAVAMQFFMLMSTTFLVGTLCLLVSCLFSMSTGGIISHTIYELIYHSMAIILMIYCIQEHIFLIASLIGLINAVLYLISAILARQSNRH